MKLEFNKVGYLIVIIPEDGHLSEILFYTRVSNFESRTPTEKGDSFTQITMNPSNRSS